MEVKCKSRSKSAYMQWISNSKSREHITGPINTPIQTPSQWDCCLLANYGAFLALMRVQSEVPKLSTTHLATLYY